MARLLLSLSILFFVLAPSAVAVDAPDLSIRMPSTPYLNQVAPVYVDAFEEPGRLLYRFDAVLENEGGTLDIYGGAGGAKQAVWDGGEPTEATKPDPDEPPPPGAAFTEHDIGARFEYVVEKTHDHWHFFTAAAYELESPIRRAGDKVGFCLFDSFDTGGPRKWFPPSPANGSQTWCGFDRPEGTFVRMGLSPGAADRYASQREFQWIDIAGLPPGGYVLKATANPDGHLVEDDTTDNVRREPRTIPGVRAEALSAATAPGERREITLAATVVAPEIPARRSAPCEPSAASPACYVWPSAGTPVRYDVADAPDHGSVTLDGRSAAYTPAPGFTGVDRFAYAATDERRLTSAPAWVEVRVETPPPPPVPPTPVAGPVTPAAPTLLRVLGARRTSARTLAVRIRCSLLATRPCAGSVIARASGRRLGRRRYSGLEPGRARTVRVALTRRGRAVLARRARARVHLAVSTRDDHGTRRVSRRTLTLPRYRR